MTPFLELRPRPRPRHLPKRLALALATLAFANPALAHFEPTKSTPEDLP